MSVAMNPATEHLQDGEYFIYYIRLLPQKYPVWQISAIRQLYPVMFMAGFPIDGTRRELLPTHRNAIHCSASQIMKNLKEVDLQNKL
ncbi:hypothetical protein [Lactiplantibacillus plantarum]|uniref:hypothetical protein n=1 Tax=Lactiplantibacillus plantarum TaxID=1590 RepID=UPI000CB21496|nr:hypothetical protein [Lactiplantibacillus plantarum]PMD99854.1 hypothetical protein S101520_03020 [Lactiplantibacillus plantarum subsp. plantarum]